jgi:hypothetical protein
VIRTLLSSAQATSNGQQQYPLTWCERVKVSSQELQSTLLIYCHQKVRLLIQVRQQAVILAGYIVSRGHPTT